MSQSKERFVSCTIGQWNITIRVESTDWNNMDVGSLVKRVFSQMLLHLGLLSIGFDILVDIVLSDDQAVRLLNKRCCNKDISTNILSFNGCGINEASREKPCLLGGMILAYKTVEREALEQNKTLINHISHLLVHGFLHLIGYDHKKRSDARSMESIEVSVLASLGIDDPYVWRNDCSQNL